MTPEALVIALLAVTLVIIGLGARLFADAHRQGRNRRFAALAAVEVPDGADEDLETENAEAAAPAEPHFSAHEHPIAAAAATSPSREPGPVPSALIAATAASAAAGMSEAPPMAIENAEAFERHAYAASLRSLRRITGQADSLLALPAVRRNENIDMAVRSVAAEARWLLRALESFLELREDSPPDTELCSIAGLLQDVDEEVGPLAADARNTCSFHNEAGELWLLADAAQIRVCLRHFVSAVCLAVREAHISVTARRAGGPDGAEIRWTITDDGRAQAGRPVAPFWLQSTESASILNLTLAEEIGARLAGALSVEGMPGCGGSIVFAHPVIIAADPALAAEAGECGMPGDPQQALRVLAVGGDGETNALLQRCFSYYGHQVRFASDIVEAARAAEPERPDAIVCDLDSPACSNGLLALSLAVGYAASVPIVGLRELTSPGDELPVGCAAVVAKGQALEKLVPRVRESVRRSGGGLRSAEAPASSRPASQLLIVDGDQESVAALTAKLEPSGLHVQRVDQAREALVALESSEFDAILIAEALPDMSGLELLRILRSRYTASQLPVLVTGNAAVPETVVQAIAFGANDFLAKPFDGPVTIARISTQLARRRAEQALRDSEERYMLTARGANDGLWDWDCRSGNVHYSPRWKEMLGLHPDTEASSVIEWLSRVHPEDRPELERQLDQALREPSIDEIINEHRILHLDGLHRWVLCRAVVLHDDEGRPIRVAGSHTDITRTKANDSLTGLANRVMFNDRAGTFMDRYNGDPGRPFAVLFLDLDRFKIINDSLGHMAGDLLLVEIGRRLVMVIEDQLPEMRHLVARLGGDEFGVLIMPATEAVARGLAESLLIEIARPFLVDGREISTSASIGIACIHPGYRNSVDLIRDADTAMYRAKAKGKDRYEVFDATMHAAVVARAELGTELAHAIRSGQFALYYQPKYELVTGRLAGFEALVRWQHPSKGLLMPNQFVPVAEETGLIVPLGSWVIEEACRQLQRWAAHSPAARVSVNVSARQFQKPDLVAEIQAALSMAGVSPSALQIEVTESVVAEDIDQSGRILTALKQAGVEVELDDFGTGYSSLSQLATLPLDSVKIDRSFVTQLRNGSSGVEVVRAILTLASSLNMKVIAEGVENDEQRDLLAKLGCPVAQGYLFGGPLPAPEATELLTRPPLPPRPPSKGRAKTATRRTTTTTAANSGGRTAKAAGPRLVAVSATTEE